MKKGIVSCIFALLVLFSIQNIGVTQSSSLSSKKPTVLSSVMQEPIAQTELFGGSFGVVLKDCEGNSLEGKTIHWENSSNVFPVNTSCTTNKEGIAVFSYNRAHSDYIQLVISFQSWKIYFEGDGFYNSSTYNLIAEVSNGGCSLLGVKTIPQPASTSNEKKSFLEDLSTIVLIGDQAFTFEALNDVAAVQSALNTFGGEKTYYYMKGVTKGEYYSIFGDGVLKSEVRNNLRNITYHHVENGKPLTAFCNYLDDKESIDKISDRFTQTVYENKDYSPYKISATERFVELNIDDIETNKLFDNLTQEGKKQLISNYITNKVAIQTNGAVSYIAVIYNNELKYFVKASYPNNISNVKELLLTDYDKYCKYQVNIPQSINTTSHNNGAGTIVLDNSTNNNNILVRIKCYISELNNLYTIREIFVNSRETFIASNLPLGNYRVEFKNQYINDDFLLKDNLFFAQEYLSHKIVFESFYVHKFFMSITAKPISSTTIEVTADYSIDISNYLSFSDGAISKIEKVEPNKYIITVPEMKTGSTYKILSFNSFGIDFNEASFLF